MASASQKDFVGGWIGGLCRIPVGHPFDTCKVLMQTGNEHLTMAQCFARIWREQGLRGLYRGAQSPALGMAALNATLFVSYGLGKDMAVRGGLKAPGEAFSAGDEYLTGMFAGVFCSLAEGPVDLVKCQLQTRPAEYRGFFHCAALIARTYGLRGVFQGLGPTLVRNIPAYGFFFATYASASSTLASSAELAAGHVAAWKVLLAGGAAGAAFWTFTYPVDVIKSAMQSDAPDPRKRAFASMGDAARAIVRADGLVGFAKGFAPCLVRSMPANAAAWYGYDVTQKAFRWFGW